MELVKTSPALKTIGFVCEIIGISEIANILKYSKNREMDMTLWEYNSMLALIKGDLEVVLRINDGNIDENIFKQKMQRLKIGTTFKSLK